MFAGRLEESLAVQAQAARLDPGNAGIYRYWVQNLAAARRPREMLRVLTDFDSRFPGRLYRGEYSSRSPGRPRDGGTTWRGCAPAASRIGRCRPNAICCATRGGSTILRTRLAAAAPVDFVQHSPFGSLVGASPKPVAELRGWERLLAGDAAGAAREGAVLAAFVERLPKAAWNEWWRRLLMRGECGSASATCPRHRARPAALRLVGATPTFPESVHVRLMAARVLAWAGAPDDAVALLETLSRGYPGVGPATIVRDPLFSTPLGVEPALAGAGAGAERRDRRRTRRCCADRGRCADASEGGARPPELSEAGRQGVRAGRPDAAAGVRVHRALDDDRRRARAQALDQRAHPRVGDRRSEDASRRRR